MFTKSGKSKKRLSKKCPECGGVLEIIEYSRKTDDIVYFETTIECKECDYSEIIIDKKNRKLNYDF